MTRKIKITILATMSDEAEAFHAKAAVEAFANLQAINEEARENGLVPNEVTEEIHSDSMLLTEILSQLSMAAPVIQSLHASGDINKTFVRNATAIRVTKGDSPLAVSMSFDDTDEDALDAPEAVLTAQGIESEKEQAAEREAHEEAMRAMLNGDHGAAGILAAFGLIEADGGLMHLEEGETPAEAGQRLHREIEARGWAEDSGMGLEPLDANNEELDEETRELLRERVVDPAQQHLLPGVQGFVRADNQGVHFGDFCWVSHEKITGLSAEQLNRREGIIGKQYMAWIDNCVAASAGITMPQVPANVAPAGDRN